MTVCANAVNVSNSLNQNEILSLLGVLFGFKLICMWDDDRDRDWQGLVHACLLLFSTVPTFAAVKEATCKELASASFDGICRRACSAGLFTLPYGSYAKPLCGPVCNT